MTAELVAENFLNEPAALRSELERSGSLTFEPHATSGLFVASYMDAADLALRDVVDMGTMAWWRDNAHVARGLMTRGTEDDLDMARGVGSAFLTALHHNETLLDEATKSLDAPRLPVRVNANTLENDTEPREQTDSTAYTIWLPGLLALDGLLRLKRDDLAIMSKVVRYLEVRQYWQRPDQGCWEEDTRLHTSSIGAAVAALRIVARVFEKQQYPSSIDFNSLIGQGEAVLSELLPFGETPPAATYPGRQYDASHLFLVEAFNLFGSNMALNEVMNIQSNLVRKHGVIRYIADTYFGRGFTELFRPEERTAMADGRLELRDTLAAETARTQSEARWTLFDSLLSSFWGRRYEASHNPSHRILQLRHLNRYLGQHVYVAGGGLRIPELKYIDTARSAWKPNDHMPLLWAQANGLVALRQFEKTAA